ncbi:MAG: CCA tRNA nucleotidyltransferase [Planctomycetes bacterium]|nr:CCA tRNA nucleotidyltransferase [Planctomycetota bacterium]
MTFLRDPNWSTAVQIVRRLRQAGYEAFFAGGCVRDWLMDSPPHDIDITTAATPDVVRSLFTHSLPVGQKFGVTLVIENGRPFEIATFRAESGYSDGRHPGQVQFTDARHDVLRRDFTINGLLFDPVREAVIDFVGGQEDLARRTIRAIGSPTERFAEDHLRMLRAVRFAARFGFAIDPDTFQAIQQSASRILRVSSERVRDELDGIFTGPAPDFGLRLLDQSGLLACTLPEIQRMKGVAQPPEVHPEGDVFQHTLKMLGLAQCSDTALAFSILLHDSGKALVAPRDAGQHFPRHAEIGAEVARTVCRRYRLANPLVNRIVSLVAQHHELDQARGMRPSRLKRILRQGHASQLLELHRLDCLGSHGNLANWEFCQQRLIEWPREVLDPPRLVTGDDLIGLGLQPGPLFRKILEAVEEAQLEEILKSREQALEFVRSQWRPPSAKE